MYRKDTVEKTGFWPHKRDHMRENTPGCRYEHELINRRGFTAQTCCYVDFINAENLDTVCEQECALYNSVPVETIKVEKWPEHRGVCKCALPIDKIDLSFQPEPNIDVRYEVDADLNHLSCNSDSKLKTIVFHRGNNTDLVSCHSTKSKINKGEGVEERCCYLKGPTKETAADQFYDQDACQNICKEVGFDGLARIWAEQSADYREGDSVEKSSCKCLVNI